MMWRAFEALPPYFGGKRKLCPRIFRGIDTLFPARHWASMRLVDPFLGGGAVSLYAKARGFAVLCGDIAERSVLVGRAVIENDGVVLTEDDMLALFVQQADRADAIERNFAPAALPLEIARFLDNAFSVARKAADPARRAMLELLLVKYIFWLRPYSKFSSPDAFNRPFVEKRWDDIKPTYRQAIAANAEHPLTALLRLFEHVNGAVMKGAQQCTVVKGDAADTIAQGAGAEVLYLDLPYAGTIAYEKEYRILDLALGDDIQVSPFSMQQGLQQFGALLEQCSAYPLWAISYGNAVADLPAVLEIVERFRPARAVELEYEHMAAVATRAKRQANREFIILAGEGARA